MFPSRGNIRDNITPRRRELRFDANGISMTRTEVCGEKKEAGVRACNLTRSEVCVLFPLLPRAHRDVGGCIAATGRCTLETLILAILKSSPRSTSGRDRSVESKIQGNAKWLMRNRLDTDGEGEGEVLKPEKRNE